VCCCIINSQQAESQCCQQQHIAGLPAAVESPAAAAGDVPHYCLLLDFYCLVMI
jgi:hypothetical protein